MQSIIVKKVNGLNFHAYTSDNRKRNHKDKNILMLHGFPELGYSFRYLIESLSSHNNYCIAPDQRGYGKTSFIDMKEEKLSNFSVLNLTRDLHILLKKMNINKVDVIGHDFGSYIACYLSLLYPKVVNSIIIMSMPFPGLPTKKNLKINLMKKINFNLSKLSPPRKHYQSYFCQPNAEKNILHCKQGLFNFLKGYFYFKSHNYKNNKPFKLAELSAKELSKLPEYYIMMRNLGMAETIEKYMPNEKDLYGLKLWLKDKDLNYYTKNFRKRGLRNPFKWYRMMINDKEKLNIMKLKLKNSLNIPSMFIAGEADWGIYQKPGDIETMEKKFFKKFHGVKIVENAGHWVQQENPKDTAKYILDFYKNIRRNN